MLWKENFLAVFRKPATGQMHRHGLRKSFSHGPHIDIGLIFVPDPLHLGITKILKHHGIFHFLMGHYFFQVLGAGFINTAMVVAFLFLHHLQNIGLKAVYRTCDRSKK